MRIIETVYLLKYLLKHNINKPIQLQIELDNHYEIKNRLRLYYRNGFDLCDIMREKLAVFDNDINKHLLKDGSVFFGCVCA